MTTWAFNCIELFLMKHESHTLFRGIRWDPMLMSSGRNNSDCIVASYLIKCYRVLLHVIKSENVLLVE